MTHPRYFICQERYCRAKIVYFEGSSLGDREAKRAGSSRRLRASWVWLRQIPRFPAKNVEHIKSYSRRRRRRPGRRRCWMGNFCFHVGVTTTRRPNKREYIGLDRLFTTTSESEITRKNAGITRIPAFLNLASCTDLDILGF